jgi:hypothetical protein
MEIKWKIAIFIGIVLILIIGGFFMFNKEDILFRYLNPLNLLGVVSASESLGVCDTLSTANIVFVLNTSISNSGATCLTISAQNITIDCNGFNITGDNTGSSTAGILSNQFNTTIKNCTITGYNQSIRFNSGATYGLIQSNNLTTYRGTSGAGAGGAGVYLASGANFNVINNNYMNATTNVGLAIEGNNNTITNNSINAIAFYALTLSSTANHNHLQNNTCYSLNNNAYRLEQSASNNFMINESATSGTSTSLSLRGGTGSSRVKNNTFINFNITAGVSNDDAVSINRNDANNTIKDSTFNASGTGRGMGLWLSETGNLIYNNTFINRDGTGTHILINGSSYNNTFFGNNFTIATTYINNSNGTNYFNSTEGNAYPNVINLTINITGTSSSTYYPTLYIGTAGADYPYNSTNSGGKLLCNTNQSDCGDYAPLTPTSVGEPPANTCTYTSGNWEVTCSDNCNISTNVVGDGSNLYLTGIGRFLVYADISGFNDIIKDNSCELIKDKDSTISVIGG